MSGVLSNKTGSNQTGAKPGRAETGAGTGPAWTQDRFADRHIGPDAKDVEAMLRVLGHRTLDGLIEAAVPPSIRTRGALALPAAKSERDALAAIAALAEENEVRRSFLGLGYSACVTPPVLLRNIVENPGWYTQYTPYQPEISQGRLEALLNFQTMVSDLTGLPLANASLLDEGTAAAEAMHMCHVLDARDRHGFFVADDCHPQTIAVLRGRAEPLGIRLHVADLASLDPQAQGLFGALVQY